MLRARKRWGAGCVAWMLLATVGCGSSDAERAYFDECDASVTESECYATRRDPASEQVALATDIALRYIDEHPPETEIWDWTSGVLMFGMTELYRVTGDSRIRDYYQAWLDYHIEQGYELVWSDSCPPALTALALLRENDDPSYQTVVDDVLEYLRVTAPRTDEGGISHLGTMFPISSIWVDSLFMFGMVLNRWGEQADDEDALALMSEQLDIFADLLQSESGLLVHAFGWTFPFDDDIYWARGNAWVTASLADYLRIRFLRGESDATAEGIYRNQLDGILEAQDADSGMWWNIMNRPGEIYIETSAAALFAYGMARGYRYGLVGEDELDAAKRAMVGVQAAVETDDQGRPFVTGTSDGTSVGTFEGYARIPLVDDLNYGVGAVILSLVETSGL